MTKIDIVRAMSLYQARIATKGLVVEQFTDFERVPDAAAEFGRTFQMPGFDVSRVDHTERTAFWLFLRDGDQRVAGCAALLQDLGRENFVDYQKRISRHHFPNENGGGLDDVSQLLGAKMSGRLVYIGELKVRDNFQGKSVVLSSFLRLAQALAVLEWDPDWLYAFIPKRHIDARKDRLYGFTQVLPSAQRWTAPEPALRSSTEWWVGSPRLEFEQLLVSDLAEGEVHELEKLSKWLWGLSPDERRELVDRGPARGEASLGVS